LIERMNMDEIETAEKLCRHERQEQPLPADKAGSNDYRATSRSIRFKRVGDPNKRLGQNRNPVPRACRSTRVRHILQPP